MEFNMQLKYVGDLPIVSKGGVGFDHTQPDKYLYLNAAAELLEALSYGPTETTNHLYKVEKSSLSPSELLKILKKYVKNMDKLIALRDKKAEEFIEDLENRVHQNKHLTIDEKTAWLGNIKLMRNYFIQYVTNETAYEAALKALSEEIHIAKVKEVCVPMFKNYGMVLHDLVEILERQKSPIDSKIEILSTDKGLISIVTFSHP
jgi:hypothetical protein